MASLSSRSLEKELNHQHPPNVNSIPTPIMADQPKKAKRVSPQDAIDEFWTMFSANDKTAGKAYTILPLDLYAKKAGDQVPKGIITGQNASASYEEAVAICKRKVEKIVKECRRVNQKYRDPHFDIEFDLKWEKRDCLETLPIPNRKKTDFKPQSVKRVGDIFDNPSFYIQGATANDIRQGQDGDCWFMAALCTLGNKPGLIEKVCVARDETVGVYGFVFFRDSEWRSEIIDDKLYLTKPDYDESLIERILWEDRERISSEEDYRKAYQSNSGALYFAQCEDPNETWLPLLEKAYAKAHGDYAAIEGGFTGEGIEDLTGGVTTELFATDILDKEYFWNEELLKVNEEFLFGCATGVFRGWGERKGIQEGHSYSIMKAVEIDGNRLLLLKNPWGKGEWTGPWSDGSKEWTVEWIRLLDHRFGNDGAFWISYEDLLRKYQTFDRTRLFNSDWKVTQQWTSLAVPWTIGYHETKFVFNLEKPTSVVLVFSQLDSRYFRGLEGQYLFELSFRLHKAGQDDYIVRSHGNYCMRRSVSAELDLEEAGEYHVLLKIEAERDTTALAVEQVVRDNCRKRRDKLLRIGLAYDLAHAKGKTSETAEEKAAREKASSRKKAKERKEIKEKLTKEKRRNRLRETKEKKKAKAKRTKKAKKGEAKQKGLMSGGKRSTATTSSAAKDTPENASTMLDGTKEEIDASSRDNSSAHQDGGPQSVAHESSTTVDDSKLDSENIKAILAPATDDNTDKATSEALLAKKQSEEDSDSDTASDISSISSGTIDDELERLAKAETEPSPAAAPGPEIPAAEEEEDEFERDPWNAVAVVGLRVYSKDAAVTIKVVRPVVWGDGESSLDVDDSAADATKGDAGRKGESGDGVMGFRGRLGSLMTE